MSPELAAEYAAATKKSSPRPTDWDSIIGNDRAKTQIREAIAAAKKDQRPLPHLLMFGPPGVGKSTYSKIIAKDMGGICIETTASTLETPADMIRFLFALNEGRETTSHPSTFFIDEIHVISGSKSRQAIDQESIFPLLEDWTFPHNLINKPINIDGSIIWRPFTTAMPVWPFTCIGATTEPGMLSQPLLRRFLLQIELEPYTEDEIASILVGAGARMGLTITPDAAATLSKFSRRNPGTGNSLIEHARARASATDRIIDKDVALEVIERLNLYPLGLNSTDIRILLTLYERYPKGMGQAELARSVGISLSGFNQMLEPYLRLLGFCETLSRRVITARGISYLAQIGKIDRTKPDVRAALTSFPAVAFAQ